MRSRILPFAVTALLLIGSKAPAYVTPGPMFEAPGYLYSAGPTANVVLADVNLDGRADLVVGTSNDFSVALATAAGSFGTFQHFHPEWGGVEVGVGDFDGDGLPDVAGRNDTTLFVAFGDGAGGWPTSFSTPAPDRPFLLTTLRVADVNGDGRSDVAGFNRDSTLSVFLGQADRTLVTTGAIAFASGLSPQSFAIGDVTGSTAPDLVVTFYENQFVAILPGNGDGTFGGEVDVATPTDPDGVALGAADAGAPLDLFLHANVDGILYASGSGGGTFGPFSTLSGSDIGFELVLQDFNHDGNLDVATYDQRRPRSVATFLGDGLGGFGTGVDSPELIYPLYSFVSGDVDGDGNPDLAGVQNPTFPGFAVMRGHADGSFGDGPAAPPRITGSLRAAAGDFDNDGKVDAVGWNDVSKKLAFARGHGDGTFDPFVESPAMALAYAFGAAGRFDADANLDLVLVSTAGGKLSFLHGNGNGTFAAPVDWTVCGGEPTIVDLNADGRLDVVVLCKGLNTLSVLMQGAGGLAAPVTSATPPGPVAVR